MDEWRARVSKPKWVLCPRCDMPMEDWLKRPIHCDACRVEIAAEQKRQQGKSPPKSTRRLF